MDARDADRPRRDAGSRRQTLLTAAVALFAGITALRFAVSNPAEGIGFLYVIPIAVVASELGWRWSAATAGAALAATFVWGFAADAPLGPLGYTTRALTFLAVALLVGWQVARRDELEAERERLIAELSGLALLDGLTGLPNRRAWDERLGATLRHARRSGEPVTVVALDLDGLKRINDCHGHERGDQMIRSCAAACASGVREMDFVARLGGDEFSILLPDCHEQPALQVVGRILGSLPDGYSFSAGVATWNGEETEAELTQRADLALYAGKRAGGARIVVAGIEDAGA